MKTPGGPNPGSIAPHDSTHITGPRWERIRLTKNIRDQTYQHGRFVDVAADKIELVDINFSYSVFERAYFHKAKFIGCDFTGCRFTQCNFRGAQFVNCRFNYVFFDQTIIPEKEIIGTAPEWPNLRRELMQVLRANAETVGNYDAQKAFIREEMEARRDHLSRAREQKEAYYKTHYQGPKNWLLVRRDSLLLWLDRHLLGHGEHIGRAAIGSSALLIVIGLVLFGTTQSWNDDIKLGQAIGNFFNCMKFALYTLLDVHHVLPVAASNWIVILIIILRYFLIGLLVASLSRLVAHR